MPCRSASRAPEDVGEGLGADAPAAPTRPLHPRRRGVAQFTIPAERKGPRSEDRGPLLSGSRDHSHPRLTSEDWLESGTGPRTVAELDPQQQHDDGADN
jgi:hypothetical protein